MDSQGCTEGIIESGQASPMETPSTCVRVAGQIGARQSMRRFQKVGRRTIGTEAAWVVGWERRKSRKYVSVSFAGCV